VTGVLLNFRAYDTLLELAVLLTALLGILALGPARAGYLRAGPVLAGLTRWLLPPMILVSGYLLWVGAHAPGGAFQAGALLAASGVLLRLAGFTKAGLPSRLALRAMSVAGVALFVGIGLTLMLVHGVFLAYPVAWAGSLILVIETAATLGIGVTLVLALLGGEPPAWQSSAASAAPLASQTSGGESRRC
jgi:multisubunit Na+/H+ antiporter MnhB subunit